MQPAKAEGLSFRGRVRGLLYGIAFGDAFGAPVEKLPAGEIRARYGRVTALDTQWHRMNQSLEARKGRIRGNGIVTDDTLMTLCLMEVYAEAGRHLDAWDMADGMVRQIAWTPRWVPELQRETMLLERLFYPEKWIFQRHQLASCEPREGGIGNMVNCGAAMYMAPIGVLNACDPRAAYDEAIAFASGHQQSFGLEAAGAMAAAVAAAFIPGATIDTVLDEVLALAKDGTRRAISDIAEAARALRTAGADYVSVVSRFHQVIAKYSPMRDDVNHNVAHAGAISDYYRPSRLNSIEELPLALGFCLLNDGHFHRSVEDGVNSGRDTDTIGVMAGAILGAMHGEAIIEEAERNQLDQANRFELIAMADRFAEVASTIIRNDLARQQARANILDGLLAPDDTEIVYI